MLDLMSDNTKRSRNGIVWEVFEISSVDSSKANCKLCRSSLARGGNNAEKAHSDQWAAAKVARSERKPTPLDIIGQSARNRVGIRRSVITFGIGIGSIGRIWYRSKPNRDFISSPYPTSDRDLQSRTKNWRILLPVWGSAPENQNFLTP